MKTTTEKHIIFDKYDKRGAYHWKWYRQNQHNYRVHVDRVVNYFPAQGRVLDVGCGDALIAYKLAQRGLTVHGIDTSQTGIVLGRESVKAACNRLYPKICKFWRCVCDRNGEFDDIESRLTLSVQSAYDLDESRLFDCVLCHEVIEHVPDPVQLIRVLSRITRNMGVFTTPNSDFVKSHELDYFNWNPDSFMQLFQEYRPKLMYVDETTIHVRAHFR